MRRAVGVMSVIVGLGLGGLPATPASAQMRVMVPIVIRQPGPGAPTPAQTSVQVTTRTVSPQPGVTQTHVTIQDTTGVAGYASARPRSTEPGVSRVTIQDTTGVAGYASARPRSTERGVNRVTIQDTTTVGDGPAVIVPFPVILRHGPGGQPQSLTITTDAPIDTPLVILGP